MSASGWWPSREQWSRWDAWRVGVIEYGGDSGITWPEHDPDPYHPMSVAYDEGREWADRQAAIRDGWSTTADHRARNLRDLLDLIVQQEDLPEIEYAGPLAHGGDLEIILETHPAAYVSREPDGGASRYYVMPTLDLAREAAYHDALGPTYEDPIAILDLDRGTYRVPVVSVTWLDEVTA